MCEKGRQIAGDWGRIVEIAWLWRCWFVLMLRFTMNYESYSAAVDTHTFSATKMISLRWWHHPVQATLSTICCFRINVYQRPGCVALPFLHNTPIRCKCRERERECEMLQIYFVEQNVPSSTKSDWKLKCLSTCRQRIHLSPAPFSLSHSSFSGSFPSPSYRSKCNQFNGLFGALSCALKIKRVKRYQSHHFGNAKTIKRYTCHLSFGIGNMWTKRYDICIYTQLTLKCWMIMTWKVGIVFPRLHS